VEKLSTEKFSILSTLLNLFLMLEAIKFKSKLPILGMLAAIASTLKNDSNK
jgi:hypothetical protein